MTEQTHAEQQRVVEKIENIFMLKKKKSFIYCQSEYKFQVLCRHNFFSETKEGCNSFYSCIAY